MKKNNINKLLSIIISVSFIIGCFLMSVHFCCYDEAFYKKEHEEIMLYGKHINEHIGITNEELDELTSFTLKYLNDPNSSLDKEMNIKGIKREVFTDEEKLHMIDVRKLNLSSVYILQTCIVVFILSIIIFIKTNKGYIILYNNYKKTLTLFLIFFGIIGFWIILDFNSFWTFFHKIFFSGNDLWILDLRKDILIMIVPPQFFNNLVKRILFIFIISILLFGIILNFISRKKKIYD